MMMYLFRKWILLILFLVPVQQLGAQLKLTVAVAANMQYASEALKTAFEKATNIKVDIIIGSSGKLTQQIITGAPFDVFISADTSFPEKLLAAGQAAETPRIYAQGLLVLWTMKKGIQPASDLHLLLSDNIVSIAIANPQTAPYGAAAEALLKKYRLYDKIKDKLVFGESITQTSQFISSQSADIGFTAKAIVLSKEMSGKGSWVDVNKEDYPPIYQSAVLLAYGRKTHPAEAKKFYDFLFSAGAKNIFKEFGYIVK